ncbi:protein SIEVE ELEMENT OCCLUSION C-like isoform X2 [Typha latifolia]|uniref:protein SIEVE ELEMENT OCCLUSION C-like isoform X2 n=1 Tax=Typha latifolia TaxID=4733 RepID=UPI003C2C2301
MDMLISKVHSVQMKQLHIGTSCDDILMKKILQTHLPDDSTVDSAPLIHLIESILHAAPMPSVNKLNREEIQANSSRYDIGLTSSIKTLAWTINRIASEILQSGSGNQFLHATTMAVLELLGSHSWSTKLVIVLAGLAIAYGNFWLIMQFRSTNCLALSIATLKGQRNYMTPRNLFELRLKALRYLLDKMVSVTKCILEFEVLHLNYVNLGHEEMAVPKTQIHKASYWVIRSAVECASQITSLIALNFESKESNVIAATWELWSLACKVSDMNGHLRKQYDEFNKQIEKNVFSSLLQSFEDNQLDKQKFLRTLFALKDECPLLDCLSNKKVGIDVLREEEVMIFISSVELCLEELLLLEQQLDNGPHYGSEISFKIVWVPIAKSAQWSTDERKTFHEMIDILPWYSLYEPSNLSSSAIQFFQEVWQYQGDPLMVVLDSEGKIKSINAINAISIWGTKAYPFSVSRERDLWKEQSWTVEFLFDDLDPIISYWIEDRRNICIYGSDDLRWIRELINKMNEINRYGKFVELIYVGSKYHEQTRDILSIFTKENLSSFLSFTKICMFWSRLKSMHSSKLHLGYAIESDSIMGEVNSLLNFSSEHTSWLLLSERASTEIVKLPGNKALELLSEFHVWEPKISKFGFLGAMRKALDTPSLVDHCEYFIISPDVEDLNERIPVCEKCNCHMKKHYMYQCLNHTIQSPMRQ